MTSNKSWITKFKETGEKNILVWLAITFFSVLTLGWGLRETIINVTGQKVVSESEFVMPVASFKYEIKEDGLVKFYNNSKNAKSVQWDFGDGSFGSIQDSIHQFEKNGKYNVKLIVANETGNHENIITVHIKNVALAQKVFYADISSKKNLPIFIKIDDISKGVLSKSYDLDNLPDCYADGTITVSLPAGKYSVKASAKGGLYTWDTTVEFVKGICTPFGLSSS